MTYYYTSAIAVTIVFFVGYAYAQPSKESNSVILIQNVTIFDGEHEELIDSMSVLIEDNHISKIAANIERPKEAKLIDAGKDGKSKVLMPGLSDAHHHVMFANTTLQELLTTEIGYINLIAVMGVRDMLMHGVTTVRDASGAVFGIKRAIDKGILPGPRIYPSGAMISQTSGHADYRSPNDLPAPLNRSLSYAERMGMAVVADGVPAVRQRARENLMQGASQIKIAVGGGVESSYDPLDVREYSLEEMKAAVDAAKAWGTYVMVHAYTNEAINMAIDAGVQSIEHGQLMDETMAQTIAKHNENAQPGQEIWLVPQPFLSEDNKFDKKQDKLRYEKFVRVIKGSETVYKLAKKYQLKVAFGTDIIFDTEVAKKHNHQLLRLETFGYEPWEILKMATSENHKLFKLSGKRDPYYDVIKDKDGKEKVRENGVIKEQAYADIIIVNGNPLENFELLTEPHKNIVFIMKDGKIYKNILQ